MPAPVVGKKPREGSVARHDVLVFLARKTTAALLKTDKSGKFPVPKRRSVRVSSLPQDVSGRLLESRGGFHTYIDRHRFITR